MLNTSSSRARPEGISDVTAWMSTSITFSTWTSVVSSPTCSRFGAVYLASNLFLSLAVMSAVNERSTCSMRMKGTGMMVSSGTIITRVCPFTTNEKEMVSGSKMASSSLSPLSSRFIDTART